MPGGEIKADRAPPVPDGVRYLKAVVRAGPGRGKFIALRRAASLFGSKPGCKVALGDPAIKPVHCLIVNTGEKLILRDLDTGGQTVLNGLKAELEQINDGDRLRLGPWEFALKVEATELQGMGDSPVVVDLEPEPTVLAIEDCDTRELKRLPSEVTVIGRNPSADIMLQERDVSRVHAVIFTYLNRPVIFDTLSSSGTWVNGERVVFASLQNGDEMMLGSRALRFRTNLAASRNGSGGNGQILKPTPVVSKDGTISDFVDLSADSMMRWGAVTAPLAEEKPSR